MDLNFGQSTILAGADSNIFFQLCKKLLFVIHLFFISCYNGKMVLHNRENQSLSVMIVIET